jgi:hypothetical protein
MYHHQNLVLVYHLHHGKWICIVVQLSQPQKLDSSDFFTQPNVVQVKGPFYSQTIATEHVTETSFQESDIGRMGKDSDTGVGEARKGGNKTSQHILVWYM